MRPPALRKPKEKPGRPFFGAARRSARWRANRPRRVPDWRAATCAARLLARSVEWETLLQKIPELCSFLSAHQHEKTWPTCHRGAGDTPSTRMGSRTWRSAIADLKGPPPGWSALGCARGRHPPLGLAVRCMRRSRAITKKHSLLCVFHVPPKH